MSKIKKSNYEVEYSQAPNKDTDDNKMVKKDDKSKKEVKKGVDEENLKYLNTYLHDRGAIMVSKRDLIALPNYLDNNNVH